MNYDLLPYQKVLLEILTKERFFHSLGVQDTSFSLAIRYGYPLDKAALAGLMHDCAKDITDEMLLSECFKYHIAVSEVETKKPDLLHAKLGAYYARHKYGITDTEIVSAIAYHTTGKPDMSLLEKIIFVADYIEPNRSDKYIPNLNDIRSLAFIDLDKAVYLIADNVVNYLGVNSQEMDTLTVATRDFYENIMYI
ncbi:MAG: nicotinate-nucleotide adenylyltransferase [Anaerocolumna sp.]|jgi:predicted HD superfamily hydrolase involved in NAD metabolism|nr:nicotinate-nucleotide adenylyltransferase [Anaerocolumna sp.]